MLKNVKWSEDSVYSIKLRDDLYTLVQMRKNYIMQFFDIKHSSDEWQGIDLNNYSTIFFRFVAPKGLSRIFSKNISNGEIKPSLLPIETRMLSMDLSQAPNYSARLVELTNQFDTIGAKELTGRLEVPNDLDTIYRYELDGSEGRAEKISKRLIRYFETGVNWDDSKEFIFKGAPLPPPYYGNQ
jgi:hypothetical protein